MNWIALKMLTGDRGKYFGIVFGIAFATLLMGQQSSIFCGIMRNTTSQIRDVEGADVWVMDPNVQFIDDVKPLSDDDLYRVRGVEDRFGKVIGRRPQSGGEDWNVSLQGVLTRP